MKTFEQFLNEMAISSGINDLNNHSREATWITYYKDKNFKKLLLKDIGGEEHLRFYKVGGNSYYLTDDEDNYKGNIETRRVNNTIVIKSSNSKLKRGFYNIMFSCIFASGEANEILSDFDLSEQAIDSYSKIAVNGRLFIQVFNPNTREYYPFSKEKLLSDIAYRVSIKEKNDKSLKEHFEEYYKRINETESVNGFFAPSSFKSTFDNRLKGLNNYLFCEDYTITSEEYEKMLNWRI